MNPKTRVQKSIVELSSQLPQLTPKQEKWAMDNASPHIAFFNSSQNSVWCTECGCSSHLEPKVDFSKEDLLDPGEEYVCPHCGARLKVCKSRKQKYESKEYVTYITTKGGYQVLRHFMLIRNSRKGKETMTMFSEAVQEWISENGTSTYIARPRSYNPYYCDNWVFTKPMEIRDKSRYGANAYRIFANCIYPYMSVIPQLRRNGFKSSFHDVTPGVLFSALLKQTPNTEWLLKSKQYAMMEYSIYYGVCFRESVKICIRNNYRIKDAVMWKDYLQCLDYFGKDLHNAYYVCPKNLRKAHDYWMKKKDKAEKKRKEEERRMNAAKWEEQYAKTKGKFLGIAFSCPGINVTVLPSVAAFVEEADHMHHCVYSNEYYKKPESLILSAKDDKGKRLETIEVNLKTFSIVQCYGACNKFTPQHEQIKELVNKNMNLIRKAV